MYYKNEIILQHKHPLVLNKLNSFLAHQRIPSVQLIDCKNGSLSIQGDFGSDRIILHSKYNPEREADSILKNHEKEIEKYEYVLIFGGGLGYLIEAFMKKFPKKIVILYEPDIEIFSLTAKHFDLYDIQNIYVGEIEDNIRQLSNENFNNNIYFLPMPSYLSVYGDYYNNLLQEYNNYTRERKMSVHIEATFEKRWMLNSVKNFEKIYSTPNLMSEDSKREFKNKKVLIVSAGPSLDDEIENLKKIKKEGLAYIFSVGSAIRTLYSNGIKPDAMFSFDPSQENLLVFNQLLEEGINDIPLIFGSTITHEVIERYDGFKANVLINRDGLNNHLFSNRQSVGIYDSPTVACFALQVLLSLETNLIIFVGQNLAYRDEQIYSKDIPYYQDLNTMDFEKNKYIQLKGVDGNIVYSEPGYVSMKESLEAFIKIYNRKDIINTTKNGAHIEGTTFISLETVIENQLKERIVDENWLEYLKIESNDDKIKAEAQLIVKKFEELNEEKKVFCKNIKKIKNYVLNIEKYLYKKRLKRVEEFFGKYDISMTVIEKNLYYNKLILPSIIVFLRQESEKASTIIKKKQSVFEKETEKLDLVKRVIEMMEIVHTWLSEELIDIDEAIKSWKCK